MPFLFGNVKSLFTFVKDCLNIYTFTMTLKFFSCFRILLLLSVLFSGCTSREDFTKYADPFLGSVHCRWFFFTPASVPMGMAKLSPHTNAHYGNQGGWEPVGYDYRDNTIEGFGHFHEFQIGGLVSMPTVGKIKTSPGDTGKSYSGYRSGFLKKTEIAEPGYYSVHLKDYNIKAELTATERVGFHRYTYPETEKAKNIIFDIGHQQGESGPVLDAGIKLKENGELEGYIITSPVYVQNYNRGCEVRMYFVIKLDATPSSWGVFREDTIYQNLKEISGSGTGMYLTFSTNGAKAIGMKVGLSYTGIDNARLNLYAESDGISFNKARKEAKRKWNEVFSRIEVKDGNLANKIKFYTGLYHAMLGRGISSDVNGAYPMYNGKIGHIPLDRENKPEYSHYNSDATWGAFWNLEQVWSLAYPEVFSSFVRSNLDIYNDCGWLPDGVAGSCFVPGVPSNFMGLLIASAYNHGIKDFDVQKGYQAALKNETGWQDRPVGVGKYDTRDFIEKGFITNDVIWQGWKFSASHTLEYCFSAFAVGEFAKNLGKTEDYRRLISLAGGYKNLFDSAYGYMRPVESDGVFVKDFSPKMVWNGFQEGNSLQYTWYVPQDIGGLIKMMGENRFNERLDSIFRASEELEFGGGRILNSFSGLESVYNQGNQPSLHISYLFNYSGKPWLTQKWKKKICDTFYGTDPVHGYGYGQDEDQGQLGSWFVLASLGLFDVQGGANSVPVYQLSGPLFNEIIIHLNKSYYTGNQFKITCKRESDNSCYISEVKLNGKKLTRPWITHQEVISGGELEYVLTDNPNYAWCGTEYHRPPSMSDSK